MSTICKAGPKDLQEVLHHLRGFYASAIHPELVNIDWWKAQSVVQGMLAGNGVIFLAPGKGMIGGIISSPSWISSDKIAVELFWFVQEDHRKEGVADELRQAFENWADSERCKAVAMTVQGYTPEAISSYLDTHGYRSTESTFMKVL